MRDSENGWIEIVVTDTGVGIPPRDIDRIFERFYRVDRARSRDTGGTGLGLSIVRHVATNHSGEVTVQSREGRRLGVHDPRVGGRDQWNKRGERVMTPQPVVLVVEDEPSFVEALTIGLTREGFASSPSTDGFEAVQRFDEVQPDIVLLDVMLPQAQRHRRLSSIAQEEPCADHHGHCQRSRDRHCRRSRGRRRRLHHQAVPDARGRGSHARRTAPVARTTQSALRSCLPGR